MLFDQPAVRTTVTFSYNAQLRLISNNMYCIVLYCTVLYCTVLYCTVLYCTVLYGIVLYCMVLYCGIIREFSFNGFSSVFLTCAVFVL